MEDTTAMVKVELIRNELGEFTLTCNEETALDIKQAIDRLTASRLTSRAKAKTQGRFRAKIYNTIIS